MARAKLGYRQFCFNMPDGVGCTKQTRGREILSGSLDQEVLPGRVGCWAGGQHIGQHAVACDGRHHAKMSRAAHAQPIGSQRDKVDFTQARGWDLG